MTPEPAQPTEELPRVRGRRRVWIDGVLAVAAIVVIGALTMGPLVSGRDETRQARTISVALQHVTDLRIAFVNWQAFLDPQVGKLGPSAIIVDPAAVAAGTEIVKTIVTETALATRGLRDSGLPADARAVEAASKAFVKSLNGISTLTAGQPAGVIATTLAAERAALLEARTVATTATTNLQVLNERNETHTIRSLDTGRTTVLVAYLLAAASSLAAAAVLGQRVHRRERATRIVSERQRYEAALQQALDMAKTESDAYEIMSRGLHESVPRLEVEMLVADSSGAHFHQTLHTAAADVGLRAGCGVVSPDDCPAARRGHTLLFPSSQALDACPHLVGRPTGDLSAACVAISITGRSSGVVHAMGPDGQPPEPEDLSYLEVTTRRAAERIAMLRAFERSETQARTDPLTGLWNRRSFENGVHQLRLDGTPYTLAYGDLDHFKTVNDTHGHEAGDQALRLFARVMRDSVRPGDITARYGGEEFVIVFPDCPIETARKVLERLRERLALTVSNGRVPAFTVSFGLSSSTDGDAVDEVVALADQALLAAKANGRDRTVVAGEIGLWSGTLGVVPEAHSTIL
ncbi:MAG: hypothetical protein JWL73_1582 [Actinomycetia bacterium]|nr:hypothetical protein [Actinomycetes bacterium]